MNSSSIPADDSADFEQQYRLHYLAADARQTSIAIAVWLVPVLVFTYPEYLFHGLSREYIALLGLRILFCAYSIYTIAIMQTVATAQAYDWAFLRWATLATGFILFVNYQWSMFVVPNGAITILILFSSYMVFPNKSSVRFAFPVILSIGNLAMQWMIIENGSLYSNISSLVALIMVNVLGMIFSATLQRHRRTEFQARIEELKIKERLDQLASIDDLTGVFNRRKLLQLADVEFERFKSKGQRFSVIMIDIDHFKQVNDTFGHETGDTMLTMFAAFVANMLCEQDIWGRWGGEEFLLVLPGTSCEKARNLAERLRLEVKEGYSIPKRKTFPFTISIGLTEVQERDHSFISVVNRADKALYNAKRNGRNRTEVV